MDFDQQHPGNISSPIAWVHAKAELRYLDAIPLYDEVKPYILRRKGPPGVPSDNLQLLDYHDIPVYDARGHETELTLETHGFSFKKSPSREPLDNEESVSRYLAETQPFLASLFPGSDTLIFDHRFRSSGEPPSQGTHALAEGVKYRKPSTMVHIALLTGVHEKDQTPDSAEGRVRHHFPDEAELLMQRRYLLINVWRPLVERVQDCPLAVCDSRTVSDCDLVECDLVYRDYEGEFYVLHHSPAHSWFYLSGQTREEVTLLLNFDSHNDVRCAHSAFYLEGIQGAEPRRSIEVRAMVFLASPT